MIQNPYELSDEEAIEYILGEYVDTGGEKYLYVLSYDDGSDESNSVYGADYLISSSPEKALRKFLENIKITPQYYIAEKFFMLCVDSLSNLDIE